MTLRNIDRRIRKWAKRKFDILAFLLSKRLSIKRATSYWKDHPPASTDGYPLVEKVWEITFSKLKNIRRIKYTDLYEFYYTCFSYYLHFYHKSYSDNPTKIEAIKEHDKYVNYLYDQEKKRQENIDSKAKQIITNTSTVITIIGLFITVLTSFFKGKIDIDNSDFYLLISGLIFLFIALLISVIVLNFKKYSRPFPEIVFKGENRSEESFLRTKIISFHVPIILNTSVNSKKSNRLIWANYIYIFALIFVLWLATKNIYILTKNQDFDRVSIEKTSTPEQIIKINLDTKSFDTTITNAINKLTSDTINVRIVKNTSP